MNSAAEIAAFNDRADETGRFPAQTADADEVRRVVALVDHAAPQVEDQLMVLPPFYCRDEQNEALGQVARGNLPGALHTLQKFRKGRAVFGYGNRWHGYLQRRGIAPDVVRRIFGDGENMVCVL